MTTLKQNTHGKNEFKKKLCKNTNTQKTKMVNSNHQKNSGKRNSEKELKEITKDRENYHEPTRTRVIITAWNTISGNFIFHFNKVIDVKPWLVIFKYKLVRK